MYHPHSKCGPSRQGTRLLLLRSSSPWPLCGLLLHRHPLLQYVPFSTHLLVNEIAPKHLTGTFGSCHQLLLTFAIVITYFIGLILPDGSAEELRGSMSWRVAMAMPAILAMIQVLLLLTVYRKDTPTFYCNNDKIDEVFISAHILDEICSC